MAMGHFQLSWDGDGTAPAIIPISSNKSSPSLVSRGEVLLGLDVIGLHRLGARLPVGGADLAMLVGELECLDKAEGLIDIAANRQVVDGDLAQDSSRRDNEKSPARWEIPEVRY